MDNQIVSIFYGIYGIVADGDHTHHAHHANYTPFQSLLLFIRT